MNLRLKAGGTPGGWTYARSIAQGARWNSVTTCVRDGKVPDSENNHFTSITREKEREEEEESWGRVVRDTTVLEGGVIET
jgi:hypothetical protein